MVGAMAPPFRSRFAPQPLTGAQRHVLAAVRRVYERDGRATYDTVAAEAGLVKSTTHVHVAALIDYGHVERPPRTLGALRPARYRPAVFVPVLTPAQIRARFGR